MNIEGCAPADRDDALGVTHCINSGLLQLTEREHRTKKAKQLLDDAAIAQMFRDGYPSIR